MADKKQWSEMTKEEKRNGIIGMVVVGLIVVYILGAVTGGSKAPPDTTTVADTSSSQPEKAPAHAAPPVRKVAGTATTLGAGTFAGGKDVAAGLYDVTSGVAGESGNFMVDGPDSANEILGESSGMGVPKVRVRISSGDSIEISSLSQVIFTPVKAPFVTGHKLTKLYAGTFTVGEDIGAGRYIAMTTAGNSGNFMVDGATSVNEILGDKASYGVPSVTVTLTDGDVIEISSLSQMTLTPVN